MDLAEAIKQLIPLQLRIPDPRKPLELDTRYAAEVFVVETALGRGVVWLEPFWCDKPDDAVARIAYAKPLPQENTDRWVDNDPRFGPRCIPYQKPFVIERLGRDSPAWRDYKAWQTWRAMKGKDCGRRAAWQRVERELADILERRLG
jgi:hypothetical protein